MSEDTKNKQCQICHGYLFEDDDVVVCPTCGAPHHRDCYDTVGHCGVEEFHNTDKQYDIANKKETDQEHPSIAPHKCNYCGRTAKTDNADFCPYCGHPYHGGKRPTFVAGGMPFQFDPYGGVSKETKIDDVSVEEMGTFIGSNAPRYIPRFVRMSKQNKKSWNWFAFFFPAAWTLSRKMYSTGILYLILAISSSLCFVPYEQILLSFMDESVSSYSEIFALVSNNIDKFSAVSIILCFVGIILSIVPRIVCGLRGDWTYRNHTINKIKQIKSNDEVDDINEELKSSGSVSLVLMFAALLAENYLPSIIAMFIW